MPIRLLANRILVEPLEEAYKGLIIIPKTAKKERALGRGRVLQIGPGMLMTSGERWPMPACEVGDVILYYADAGVEVRVDEQTFRSVRDDDVLGVLEEGSYEEVAAE